jgi:hypothetical protein
VCVCARARVRACVCIYSFLNVRMAVRVGVRVGVRMYMHVQEADGRMRRGVHGGGGRSGEVGV